MKKVEDIMNRDVVYLSPEDSIFQAAKLFSQLNIAGAPVVENEKVIGVISISDIIRFIDIKMGKLPRIESPGLSALLLTLVQMKKIEKDFQKELKKITSYKIKEVMSKNVVSISQSSSIAEVAELMEKYDVNRLPVINNGKLVGIVARADLIKGLIVNES
jgi:CBS domain-containing protein